MSRVVSIRYGAVLVDVAPSASARFGSVRIMTPSCFAEEGGGYAPASDVYLYMTPQECEEVAKFFANVAARARGDNHA